MRQPMSYEAFKDYRDLREGGFARTMYAGYMREWREETYREVVEAALADLATYAAALCANGRPETGASMLSKAREYRARIERCRERAS